MNPIDELLYLVDGESTVRCDAATAALDLELVVARLDPDARGTLLAQLAPLQEQAERDVARVQRQRDQVATQHELWIARVASETQPLLVQTAITRRDEVQRALAAVDEEIAEYRATVVRLGEVRDLLAR